MPEGKAKNMPSNQCAKSLEFYVFVG